MLGKHMFNKLNDPCVDVIIPTYNRAEYIKESIMSVLNQSYKNLKCIVIDDASTDETEKLVRSIEDNRLIYYKNTQNKGANFCRNKGVSLSDSVLIAFNDSDDLWEPNKLRIQVNLWKKRGQGLYFSPYILVEEEKKLLVGKVQNFAKLDALQALLCGNFIGTPTILVDRMLFLDVGCFDENIERLQDWELCLRKKKKHNLYYIDRPLIKARRLGSSITEKISAKKTFIKIAKSYKENLVGNQIYLFIKNGLAYNLEIDEIKEILEEGLSLGTKEKEELLEYYDNELKKSIGYNLNIRWY